MYATTEICPAVVLKMHSVQLQVCSMQAISHMPIRMQYEMGIQHKETVHVLAAEDLCSVMQMSSSWLAGLSLLRRQMQVLLLNSFK